MRKTSVLIAAAMTVSVSSAFAQVQGPSTSRTPYVVPTAPGVITKSIFTVGTRDITGAVTQDRTAGGYTMAGIPDGAGAYDNGDGTFTMLVNHELGASAGIARAHGSAGAFVSKWVINKNTLAVVSGSDLINSVFTWNTTTSAFNPAGTTAIGRFCSADLPAQSAFQFGSVGTGEKIFMNGEESGAEGRAFGNVVTGADAGKTWQLPALGRFSWENSVANPYAQTKTIVAGTDDTSTDGQVYFYVGNKTSTGTDVDKAGLTNGNLYGIKLTSGVSQETRGSGLASTGPLTTSATFTLANLGDVRNKTGAVLNTESNTAGVMRFARPEDGAWDPKNNSDFYFVTTDTVTASAGRSRLWKTSFSDITNPAAGGTVSMLLTGTEGGEMYDNIAVINSRWGNVGDGKTRVLLQEDVGNNPRSGKIWLFDTTTGALLEVARHDAARFGDLSAATAPFSQDEEASGIIDAGNILGPGWFLMTDQTHYSGVANGISTADVEGGQLQAIYIPQAIPEPASLAAIGATAAILLRRRK